MGTIETTYDRARDLTIAEASGRMTAEAHRARIKTYYGGDTVTAHILWDVRGADFSFAMQTFTDIDNARE
jgi:hypothetical protein